MSKERKISDYGDIGGHLSAFDMVVLTSAKYVGLFAGISEVASSEPEMGSAFLYFGIAAIAEGVSKYVRNSRQERVAEQLERSLTEKIEGKKE